MTAWTRATTVANTLADRYGLEKWAQRNTVYGLGQREDLYALAASSTLEDKDELNRIVEQAQEAARARSGANLGTALHRLTERIDSGEQIDVPDSWKPDVDAYCQTLVDNFIQVHDHYIERVVINPTIGVAGMLDRLVTTNGQLKVADLKTGQHAVTYGAGEIAIQLAIYANSTHMWKGTSDDIKRDRWGRYLLPDPDDEPDAYEPMPEVDKTKAIVIHLPVGQAKCDLYEVDLQAGWEATAQAIWVREWRKRKDIASKFTPSMMEMAEATLKQQGLVDAENKVTTENQHTKGGDAEDPFDF